MLPGGDGNLTDRLLLCISCKAYHAAYLVLSTLNLQFNFCFQVGGSFFP